MISAESYRMRTAIAQLVSGCTALLITVISSGGSRSPRVPIAQYLCPLTTR